MNEDIALSRLLDSFLFKHPEPTGADWTALLKAHPEFRADIADFASIFSSLRHVDEDDVRSNFGVVEEGSSLFSATRSPGKRAGEGPLELFSTPEGREEVSREFGLQDHEELALGLFIAQVQAPASIVAFLARKASQTRDTVVNALAQMHDQLAVSMSSRSKPESMKLLTWEEEVIRLVKDPRERQRLLSLNRE